MSLTASDQFWQDFMRRPDAQKALKLEQKIALKEHAEQLKAHLEKENEELREALRDCCVEVRKLTAPIVRLPMVHRILHNVLLESRKSGIELNTLLKDNNYLIKQLGIIAEEYKADPANVHKMQDRWTTICSAAQQEVTQQSYQPDSGKTWRDMPPEDIAERLSKGEIMPRENEWVPGVSEGRRKLDAYALKEHMSFGERLRSEGNEAYKTGDLNLALTRYIQGVHLLEWVQGTNDEDTRCVDDLLLKMLKNQAQAALQLEKFNECKDACTTALKIDEFDAKSLYRRGMAYMMLGNMPLAKKDFVALLKSPYADTSDHQAGRKGLKEMKRIVTKWKTNVNQIMEKTTQAETFSEDRPIVAPTKESIAAEKFQAERRRATEAISETSLKTPLPSEVDYVPPHDEAETKELLEEMLEQYTRDSTQKRLGELRQAADYDERRILLRARKELIPSILEPILDKWGFSGENFNVKKQGMERCVGYWQRRDPEIRLLAKEIYDAILGDCVDVEI